MIHPITKSSVNVTSNPKPKCPTFWFVKLFVCEELRPAAGGEGTLVALLVARQPVVQPAAAGWGRKLPEGYQGITRGLPGGCRGVRVSGGREQRGYQGGYNRGWGGRERSKRRVASSSL